MKFFKSSTSCTIMVAVMVVFLFGCDPDKPRDVVELDKSKTGRVVKEKSSPGFDDGCYGGRVELFFPYTVNGMPSSKEGYTTTVTALRCPNSTTTSTYAVGKHQMESVTVKDGGEAPGETGSNEKKNAENSVDEQDVMNVKKQAQLMERELAEKRRLVLAKLTPEDIVLLKINK